MAFRILTYVRLGIHTCRTKVPCSNILSCFIFSQCMITMTLGKSRWTSLHFFHPKNSLLHFWKSSPPMWLVSRLTSWSYHWEQGWGSGESTHLPPLWPGFKSRHGSHTCMWVKFVVGSLPCCKRFSSGYSGFGLSYKTNTSEFQFDLKCTDVFERVHKNC